MKHEFENWLRANKGYITQPLKYSNTLKTISNHLKKKDALDIDVYSVTSFDELLKLKELYFSYDEFFQKNKRGNNMYSRSLDLYLEFLESFSGNPQKPVDPEIKDIIADLTLTSLEKESIILSRRGQGLYRKNVLKVWGKCSISGYPDSRLLIASHIKPWKRCTSAEKIDRYNGLLLLPTYDKLFDLGYIGFEGDGRIRISNQVSDPSLLQLNSNIKLKVQKDHVKYLEFHLSHVFKI
ncbi:MAG: HNH endonuclease [Lunatimonas sp.]|uniref:HNH endonuclease n=1 Tax=Lunatimonas sp. TaxID=2060141 RepID=UPI00263B3ED9|nr:HNH endonuclease signature motif containing protein [Lunatimonas sp.]MCC5937574.1 HNH endonuclease [Lunatimonas sp.]